MGQEEGDDVRQGDIREGTGGMRVRVMVKTVQGQIAVCVLTRSGVEKTLTLNTLRRAYRLISRAGAG